MAAGDGLWLVVLSVFVSIITTPPSTFAPAGRVAGWSRTSPDPVGGSHDLVL